jgi:predicted nucleic acid-binding protein
MNAWFADTYYFLALLNPRDEGHARAVEASQTSRPLVTTAAVLLEVGNFLAGTDARRLVVPFFRRFHAGPGAEIVPLSAAMMDEGQAIYDSSSDKEWSLTDCISFVVMRERSILETLTQDHHFEQAGFVALLK